MKACDVVAYTGANFSFELKIWIERVGGNRTEISNRREITWNGLNPVEVQVRNIHKVNNKDDKCGYGDRITQAQLISSKLQLDKCN